MKDLSIHYASASGSQPEKKPAGPSSPRPLGIGWPWNSFSGCETTSLCVLFH